MRINDIRLGYIRDQRNFYFGIDWAPNTSLLPFAIDIYAGGLKTKEISQPLQLLPGRHLVSNAIRRMVEDHLRQCFLKGYMK